MKKFTLKLDSLEIEMDAPNIFLVVLDSVRKDHLSTYGYDRPTSPHLTDLADVATKYTQAF